VEERTEELSVANLNLASQIQERLEIEKALHQSQRTARALLDVPHESALLIDKEGNILDINQVGAQRLGLKSTEASRFNVFELLDPSLKKIRSNYITQSLNTGQIIRWKDVRDGIHLDNRIYPVHNEHGQIESIAIYSADISNRVRAEQELNLRIAELNVINRVAQIITTVSEINNALQIVSELINSHFGARYTHIILLQKEQNDEHLLIGYDDQEGPLQPEIIDITLESLPFAEQVVSNGESVIISDFTQFSNFEPVQKFLQDREVRSILLVPLWIRQSVVGLISISRDQTEAHFSRQDGNLVELVASYIAGAMENQRLLERTKAVAAAEERSRLARDLHDAVTQTIYSASLIAEVLPRIWERSPEEGQRNLAKLRQLVRGALAEMRTLLFALRPTALDAASLETLLIQLGDALSGRTRIPVNSEIGFQEPLPTNIKQVFYRIAQESMNNIEKHSEATEVNLSLHGNLEKIILSIEDNGRGFDLQTQREKGLGLNIMQERAESVAANLEIRSATGSGTKITLSWSDNETIGNPDG
jgi:PAS domain S-box-containing protein